MNKSLDAVLQEKNKDPGFREEYMSPENQAYLIELLVEARLQQHLTQNELAQKAEIKQSNISRIEHKKTRPTLKTLQKLAHALGKEVRIEIV
jgi:ribosome-binding protein aMBF1 (putative translation factor)